MKKTRTTLRVLVPGILAMLAAFVIFLGISEQNARGSVKGDLSVGVTADTSERLEIIKDGNTNFVIHFAADDSTPRCQHRPYG